MKNQKEEKIGFAFIHGAGFTGEIWSSAAADLEHPYLFVEYPLREKEDSSRKDLHLADYVSYMADQLKEWKVDSFILVAHSLGGVPALRIAAEFPGRIAGFAAVGAAIPKNGGSFLSVLPFHKRIVMSAVLKKWGTKPPDSAIRSGLCNDLPENKTEEIVKGFIPEAVHVYTEKSHASIPEVPRLYIHLTKDREFNSSMQKKMIAHFSPDSVQQLETGHLPMLSDPEGLRRILLSFLKNINTAGVKMKRS
jgi:pimeloyl-ACP methyl ester carboxylesterase